MNPIIPILVASLTVGAGATYVAHDAGYIPMKQLMTTEEPVGYQQICSDCIINRLGDYKNILDEIPNLDKIKYEVYVSQSNHLEITQDYKNKLEQKGYSIKFDGTKTVQNMEIKYIFFIKGLTGIGIAITDGEQLGYPEAKSIVLYTTGNVMDYKEIYEWYVNGSDEKI